MCRGWQDLLCTPCCKLLLLSLLFWYKRFTPLLFLFYLPCLALYRLPGLRSGVSASALWTILPAIVYVFVALRFMFLCESKVMFLSLFIHPLFVSNLAAVFLMSEIDHILLFCKCCHWCACCAVSRAQSGNTLVSQACCSQVPTPSDLREAAAAAGTLAAVAPAGPVLGVLAGAPAEEENPAASWGAP